MQQQTWHGSMVALVTPMQDSGRLDRTALLRLLDWHVAAGTAAIVLLGTTGEAATISAEEREQLIHWSVEHLQSELPLIVGTGSNSTAHSISMSQQALDLGAQACLLVTPYYNKPTQQGLLQHFTAIAEAVAMPHILYNVPGRTGCDLQAVTLEKLAKLSNIVALKDATADLSRLQQQLQVAPELTYLSGDDATSLDFLKQGGSGVISVTANVAPELMQRLLAAATAGDWQQAEVIQQQLMPLHHALFVESNPIPVKWLLQRMQRVAAGLRLPLTPLDARYQPKLEQAAQQSGILK